MSAADDQRRLFDPTTPSRLVRRRQPPNQTTVTVSADATAAVMTARTTGERVIAEAIRAARPEVRNVAVDLGGIRWTEPKTGRRVMFDTPASVREALLSLAGGNASAPFRFVIERAALVIRSPDATTTPR